MEEQHRTLILLSSPIRERQGHRDKRAFIRRLPLIRLNSLVQGRARRGRREAIRRLPLIHLNSLVQGRARPGRREVIKDQLLIRPSHLMEEQREHRDKQVAIRRQHLIR